MLWTCNWLLPVRSTNEADLSATIRTIFPCSMRAVRSIHPLDLSFAFKTPPNIRGMRWEAGRQVTLTAPSFPRLALELLFGSALSPVTDYTVSQALLLTLVCAECL